MKVKIERLEYSREEAVFHLVNARTGDILPSSKGWKTERGARAKARKIGAEIVE